VKDKSGVTITAGKIVAGGDTHWPASLEAHQKLEKMVDLLKSVYQTLQCQIMLVSAGISVLCQSHWTPTKNMDSSGTC